MDGFKFRAIDIPANAMGAAIVACASGQWVQFGADLPPDAEFVNLMPVPSESEDDQQTLRLFFFHDSFPEVDKLEEVPVTEAELQVADEEGVAT